MLFTSRSTHFRSKNLLKTTKLYFSVRPPDTFSTSFVLGIGVIKVNILMVEGKQKECEGAGTWESIIQILKRR